MSFMFSVVLQTVSWAIQAWSSWYSVIEELQNRIPVTKYGLACRLLQERKLSCIGVVVVDELHLVSDGQRGYLLELLLTKLRYIAAKGSSGNNVEQEQANEAEVTAASLREVRV